MLASLSLRIFFRKKFRFRNRLLAKIWSPWRMRRRHQRGKIQRIQDDYFKSFRFHQTWWFFVNIKRRICPKHLFITIKICVRFFILSHVISFTVAHVCVTVMMNFAFFTSVTKVSYPVWIKSDYWSAIPCQHCLQYRKKKNRKKLFLLLEKMTENVAFGSGSDKRTFPSFVHPDRLGNENLLPVLYQDPEMGPG